MGQESSKPAEWNPYENPNGHRQRTWRWLGERWPFQHNSRPAICNEEQPSIIRTSCFEETPSWLERRQQNKKQSRLYQLPEEILLLIRDQADYHTRIILRQTCYLLLRIVLDMDKAQPPQIQNCAWRTAVATYFNGRLLFPIHGTAQEFEARRHEWRDIVYRDITLQLCPDCRSLRESPEYREKVIKLGELDWCAESSSSHPSLLFTSNAADPERRQCVLHRKSMRLLCSHHEETMIELLVLQSLYGLTTELHIYNICHDAQHKNDISLIDGNYWPPYVMGHNEEVVLVWVSPAFDLNPHAPITRHFLREMLRSFKVVGDLQFCPHVYAQDERLLLPFEPDQCACFDNDDDAKSVVGSTGGRYHHHEARNGDGNCCRCYSRDNPQRKGIFLPTGTDTVSVKPLDTSALHEYKCPQCFAVYAWLRGKGNRVYLRCRKKLNIMSQQSIANSTPNIWAYNNDQKTFQITWCQNQKCKTSARWTGLYKHGYLIPK